MADSIQGKCFAAVQTVIQDLNLTNLPDAQVYLKKLPTDRDLTLPAVVVGYPPGGGETLGGGTNARTDVGYPVHVAIIAAENQDLAIDATADQYDLWREKMILKFHHQRLAGVTEVHTCLVEPGAIVDPDAFMNRNLLAGSFIVRCIARRPAT